MQLTLPQSDGTLGRYTLRHAATPYAGGSGMPFNRLVYAAAHGVVDSLRMRDPWDRAPAVDWAATLASREHLW